MIQRCVKLNYFREVVKTPDGGLIALDWANLNASKNIILLVLPGIIGSSKMNYVTHLVDEAGKFIEIKLLLLLNNILISKF